MFYNDFIEKISKRFETRFNEIDPEWNFDIGNEFEVCLATLFSEILPEKYGVCRGFVTPKSGAPKGDDIIIYDQVSVPLIRPPIEQQFVRKENVPLEATYAYVEAKNTIEIKNSEERNYIVKAVKQTAEIKNLERVERKFNELVKGVNFENHSSTIRKGWPTIWNPMFTAVFARGARIDGKLVDDPHTIKSVLKNLELPKNSPDLLVIGPNLILVPHVREDKTDTYFSPFLMEDTGTLLMWEVPGLAYGAGLASILYALQNIRLGEMPWRDVIHEVIGDAIKRSNDRKKAANK